MTSESTNPLSLTTGQELIDKADRFLILCEQRELDEASRYLAPEAVLTFPGGVKFHSLDEMVEAAAGRYQKLTKNRQDYLFGMRPADGLSVVTSLGTFSGIANDGRAFNDIRYVDMFVFRDGLICEQNVFNDLAERGFTPGSSTQS